MDVVLYFFGFGQLCCTNGLLGFLIHAMALSDNVVFLTALKHFGTRTRIRDIQKARLGLRQVLLVPTPCEWPSSGLQLTAAHSPPRRRRC